MICTKVYGISTTRNYSVYTYIIFNMTKLISKYLVVYANFVVFGHKNGSKTINILYAAHAIYIMIHDVRSS